MRSLKVRCIIDGDVHELFDITQKSKEYSLSCFAWMIPYNIDLEDQNVPPFDAEESANWYWCAIGRIVEGEFIEAKWFYDVRE